MAKFSQKIFGLDHLPGTTKPPSQLPPPPLLRISFLTRAIVGNVDCGREGKGGGALEKKVSRKISYGNFRPKVRGRRAQKVHICRRKKIRRDQNVKYGPHGPSLAPKVNKFRRRLWAIIGNTPEHAFY